MPQTLWTGHLRLSLVMVPVRLHSALSAEEAVSFRQIHKPSGQPIRLVKGVRDDAGEFTEVPEDEIVKGYEHTRGQHVLIRQKEIDALKLEASHTIDMARFVDKAEIDARYWEKPYYLMPDGDAGEEGYAVLRDALAQTGKVAVGKLIMTGREHLIGIRPLGRGLVLSILRYGHEVRPSESYFDGLSAEASPESVRLATQIIEAQFGPFEPESMPDEFAAAVRELVQAKLEQRAPEIEVKSEKAATSVVDIMSALKKSVEAKAAQKPRDVLGKTKKKVARAKAPSPSRGTSRQPRQAR
jgi:DNA end-binding protein Ku